MKLLNLLKKGFFLRFMLLVMLPVVFTGILIILISMLDFYHDLKEKYTIITGLAARSITSQWQRMTEDTVELGDYLLFISRQGLAPESFLPVAFTNPGFRLMIEWQPARGERQSFFPAGKAADYGILQDFFPAQPTPEPERPWFRSVMYVPPLEMYVLKLTVFAGASMLSQYFDLAGLFAGIGELPDNNDWFLTVTDRLGHTINHSSSDKSGVEFLRPTMQDLLQAGSGIPGMRKYTYGGITYLDFIDSAGQQDWFVVLHAPLKRIIAFLVRQILIFFFFILAVLIMLGFYNLKWRIPLLRTIQGFIRQAEQAVPEAQGSFEIPLWINKYLELNKLADSFKSMLTAINNRERELMASEEKLRRIFEVSPDPIVVTDLNGNVMDCNPEAITLFGYDEKNELIGLNSFQFIEYDDLPRARESLVKTLDEGSTKDIEYRIRKKNGEQLYIELSSSLVYNTEHEPTAFVAILKDISERKKIEQERKQIIKNLEDKQIELERFTYTVSHDLRSPLITIKGFLGFLEEDLVSQDTEQLIADIKKIAAAVDKMNELLNDLLELSRIGRLSSEKEFVSLNMVLDEVLQILDGPLKMRGIEVSIDPGLPGVYGNYKRLVELYQNLIENAAKYMGNQPHPVVEIGYKKSKFETVYFVKDNGIGIDPRFHEKIFGLFDQLDQEAAGSGIGLALVKRIIEIHNGKVWVESVGPGGGSTFCFTFG